MKKMMRQEIDLNDECVVSASVDCSGIDIYVTKDAPDKWIRLSRSKLEEMLTSVQGMRNEEFYARREWLANKREKERLEEDFGAQTTSVSYPDRIGGGE